ncbi:immunity 53 family protein [Winogradskyella litorisediminis]|uniref:Immunity 53 family protein n=1 Tax=Winogradskyella litorisediminis TaxID=1156618 RepID=A0ABW3NBW0_9FLAO
MDTIDWIQDWFQQHCDGDWEKDEVIQITNLANPGWEVEIDISKTSIANLEIKWILNEINRKDWYGVKVENQKFLAAGDINKLPFLLNLFRDMIEKIEEAK